MKHEISRCFDHKPCQDPRGVEACELPELHSARAQIFEAWSGAKIWVFKIYSRGIRQGEELGGRSAKGRVKCCREQALDVDSHGLCAWTEFLIQERASV